MLDHIINFIKPELVILIPVLYLIGTAIKKSELKNKIIPLLLGACGVIIACIYVLASGKLNTTQDFFAALFTGITQGVLCAGASVYIDQIIKQSKKEE